MLAEIHVSPNPPGTGDVAYAHVEAAIAVVEASGLHYEVGALGTTFEGGADQVWATLRAAHEAVLASGATSVITSVRLGERTPESDDTPAGEWRMERLTAKFRQ
ncbi:MAG TPA: thiamine-binding protein [Ilumatobacter sp.]|nr:thiamine-binding protein [Ilumatobacter sp.]